MAEGAKRQILKFIVSSLPEMAFSDLSYLYCYAYTTYKFIFTGLSGFRLETGISYRNPCNFL
jgi:hypothetical protein